MDYLSDKLNSVTGRALSSVNDMKHKRRQKDVRRDEDTSSEQQAMDITCGNMPPSSANYLQQQQRPPTSQPFGGDTFYSHRPSDGPPPIGFHLGAAATKVEELRQIKQTNSDQSLYQTDTWSRLWFQRVMILTLLRLILFIRKVYEDYRATKHYRSAQMLGHFLLALATLLLPTLIFTLYRLARYLQLALASSTQITSTSHRDDERGNEESRALMDSNTPAPGSSSPPPVTSPDEDGLVTARQTPTNLHAEQGTPETFHEVPTTRTNSPTPTAKEQIRETVEVDKLGALPDREGTRILIGASEQILHGSLFIFWQLKRQVDVVGYLVERSCLWRKPKDEEKRELDKLATGSDGLEWFQDFYAAFLATLTQVYALGLHWTSPQVKGEPMTTAQLSATQNVIGASGADISQTARAISNTLGQQQALGAHLEHQDLLIMSQLIVSLAVISSLLVAVRRRDDGPLTMLLSMLGWASIFGSRIIVIALAFVHIGWRIMLPLTLCHILAISAWIYKIALDSHNDKPGESEEAKWDLELEEAIQNNQENQQREETQQERQPQESKNTDQWSYLQHLVLITQILILFALPSLFYWPIMFNLKLHYRPYKYLVLVLAQNFLLIPAIWFHIIAATAGQWYLLSAAAAFSTIGFIFLFLYVSCKPSLTEYFARADELFNEAERSGIYFEFCSRVFKLPDLSRQTFRRLMNQTEVVVEKIDEE